MRCKSIFIIAFALFLACCVNRKKGKIAEPASEVTVTDSTYIFNGRNLDGWEITNFGPQGPVYVSGNELVLGAGDGCTGVTYKNQFPVNSYEITLEAQRVSGTDFFCGITFPVKDEPCTLIIGGWGGTTVGLSSINGMDASENETTRNMKFENERWYDIKLRVKNDSIRAWIDDSVVVSFFRGNKKLSIRPEVELSRPFGIASWKTTASLRNIRVHRIN